MRPDVERVGDYEIVRFLGAGGMGTVYEVVHVGSRSRRAMKVLSEQYRHAPPVRQRFEREAGIMSTLGSHPHILGAEALIEEGDVLAVVMELIDGGDLAQALEQRPGGLPWEEVWSILAPVLDAVAFAHTRDVVVVHRDLKPANILLRRADRWPGVPVVADFGIAKVMGGAAATKLHAEMGTPGYGAPEQFRNAGAVGPEADVWALAMLVWRMVTGGLPFDPDDNLALIRLQEGLTTIPRLREVPEHVAVAIERALSVDPRKRPKNARVLMKLLSPGAAAGSGGDVWGDEEASDRAAPVLAEAPSSGLAAPDAREPSGPVRRAWWRTQAAKVTLGVSGLLLVGSLAMPPRSGAKLWADFLHLVATHGEDCDKLTRVLEPFMDRHEAALRAFSVRLRDNDSEALLALIAADDDALGLMNRFGEVTDSCKGEAGFVEVYLRAFPKPED
jgi:serine/threonine-protein kinase